MRILTGIVVGLAVMSLSAPAAAAESEYPTSLLVEIGEGVAEVITGEETLKKLSTQCRESEKALDERKDRKYLERSMRAAGMSDGSQIVVYAMCAAYSSGRASAFQESREIVERAMEE